MFFFFYPKSAPFPANMGNDFGSTAPDEIVVMSCAGGNKIDC